MTEIKHSVIVITYNQEDLLPAALNSLFSQPVLPYEIIIGDDCSTDGTWDVIQTFYKQYPQIIRPIRHSHNLGIFQNINTLKPLPTGDIVSILAGDDFYEPGIFETFNEIILKNQIDLNNDFIIISNTASIYPNGKRTIYDNTPYKDLDLFKVKIRYGLDFRETGFSAHLFKSLDDIPLNLGYHADWLFAIDQIVKAKQFYFINKVFPVYRSGIGVATKTKYQIMQQSRIDVINQIKEKYKTLLATDDLTFLEFEQNICQLSLGKKAVSMLKFISLLKKLGEDTYITKQQYNELKRTFLLTYRNYLLEKLHLYTTLKKIKNLIKHSKA